MGGLARLRRLRGTPFDIFGYTAERRQERRLVEDFERMLEHILPRLTTANHGTALALARLPERIRGFGPVKDHACRAAKAEERRLLERFERDEIAAPTLAAAE
jgi:indolepyruvate ferredoxin oxidoreductase